MDLRRKPLQGVTNIVRFNWHFYLLIMILLGFGVLSLLTFPTYELPVFIVMCCLLFPVGASLVVSWYVYDRSDLYQLPWLNNLEGRVLVLNAGFDEITDTLRQRFIDADFQICDFYNADKHTELSIQRARKAYPPDPSTISVDTSEHLPFDEHYFDNAIAMLSLHEIRSATERVAFLSELHRTLKPSGKLYITEHLRNMPNFIAYNIGFLHFHSKKSWAASFFQSNFTLLKTIKTTPFITTFILQKNGNSLQNHR